MERNRFGLSAMVQELRHSWVGGGMKLNVFFPHYVIKLRNTLLKVDMKAENTHFQVSGDRADTQQTRAMLGCWVRKSEIC